MKNQLSLTWVNLPRNRVSRGIINRIFVALSTPPASYTNIQQSCTPFYDSFRRRVMLTTALRARINFCHVVDFYWMIYVNAWGHILFCKWGTSLSQLKTTT